MKPNYFISQLLCVILLLSASTCTAQTQPLSSGYAHNDYLHKHPLHDALTNGYTYFEADVFHVHNKFVVAHLFPFFKPGKDLESLYLRPLYDHIKRNNGYVYAGYNRPVTLMIDIKINGNKVYPYLKELFEKYKEILTSYNNGVVTEKQVTIVLTGSKPYRSISRDTYRLAFIDENLKTIDNSKKPNSFCPIASCSYNSITTWDGTGTIPEKEREKLISIASAAHQQGKKIRLWASPEREEVWTELLSCGVDLINTDQLVLLRKFLLSKGIPSKVGIPAGVLLSPAIVTSGK